MKTLKILEVMWFTIMFLFFAIGIFQLTKKSLSESMGYFIIGLIAFAFGFARRRQRIRKLED